MEGVVVAMNTHYRQKSRGKKVCMSKVAYPSKEVAWKISKRLHKDKNQILQPYKCYWGDHYHLTSNVSLKYPTPFK